MENTRVTEQSNAAGRIVKQTHSTVNKAASVASLALLIFAVLAISGCAAVGNAPKGATSTQDTNSAATISVSPKAISFGSVAIGSTSSQSVSISNGGGSSLTVTQASAAAAGITITGASFPLVIDAGKQALLNVVFTPKAAGALSGGVSIMSNLSSSPTMVSLIGTATAATSLLTASASSLSFGNVTIGKNSSLSVTFTNSGNSDITVSNVSLSGSSFSANGVSAGLILTPGQSAVLNTMFTATVAGNLTGSVTVVSNATDSPMTISLAGDGTQSAANSVSLSWSPSTSTIAGYNVYRSEVSGGPYAKLDSTLVSLDSYTDSSVQAGMTYYYVVTSVNSAGIESADSTQVAAVIPAS
jgi:hypothetical protein